MLALAIALLAGTALTASIRGRLTAAERTRVELEAFRAALGIPEDRFRVVDVGLGWSLARALRPWARPPRFADVHRLHHHPALEAQRTSERRAAVEVPR